jgi:uncharacterized protein (DUF58 family)
MLDIRDRRAAPNGDSGDGAEPLFGPETLQGFEKIRLALRRVAPTLFRGEHRARRYGRGIEFSDYRPYVDGDDERDVDWPAYLRSDKLLVRRFEEEGDLRLYLFLDRSRSMATPDRGKFDLARRLAATLAYIGLTQHDRVYLLPFGDRLDQTLLDLRGRDSIHRVLDHLSRLEARGHSNLASAVDAFFSRPRRRGLVMLFSDFLFPFDEQAPPQGAVQNLREESASRSAFDRLVAREQTVLAVHLQDLWQPPPPGGEPLRLRDAESGDEIELEASTDTVAAYQQAVAEHTRRVAHVCKSSGCHLHVPALGATLESTVLELFRSTQWL